MVTLGAIAMHRAGCELTNESEKYNPSEQLDTLELVPAMREEIEESIVRNKLDKPETILLVYTSIERGYLWPLSPAAPSSMAVAAGRFFEFEVMPGMEGSGYNADGRGRVSSRAGIERKNSKKLIGFFPDSDYICN